MHGRPLPRLWLVFFGNFGTSAWWTRWFADGFTHVCAAAWYDEAQRWVFLEPTRRGTVIEVKSEDEFTPRFADLMARSTAVLRMRSTFDRNGMPALAYCVGEIKSLIGVRCWAPTPWRLYRALIARGAEIVVQPVQLRQRPAGPDGDSRSGRPAHAG